MVWAEHIEDRVTYSHIKKSQSYESTHILHLYKETKILSSQLHSNMDESQREDKSKQRIHWLNIEIIILEEAMIVSVEYHPSQNRWLIHSYHTLFK